MFNTYINKSAPAYPQKVTVHEHRAPTEKSIELLDEFKREAEQAVIDSFIFDGNEIKGLAVVSHCSPLEMNQKLVITFTLNGENYRIDEVLSNLDMSSMNKIDFYKKLCKTLAEQIAIKIMMKAIKEITV